MWIEATKNGKFKACERYIDPLTGKTKRVTTTIDKDTIAARKAAEGVLRAKIESMTTVKIDDRITLKELSKKYIDHQKQSTKPGTYTRDEILVNKVVSVLGDDVHAGKLTARYVDQKLRATGKDGVGLNTYLSQFKRMMRWGYRMEYIEDISFLNRLPAYPDPEKKLRIEDKYLSLKELKVLLDGMKNTRWHMLTEFLALSGLRIGEAVALNDSAVTDVIVVNKTVNVITGVLSESAKTDAGNREVFVQDELKDVVREIRAYIRKEKMMVGYRSDLFFPQYDGDYLKYFAYNKYLKETTERILGRSLTPHALRHTHVSLLAEQGVPLDVISRRVGHEDSKITKEIYLHVTEHQKEKDNAMLKNVSLL